MAINNFTPKSPMTSYVFTHVCQWNGARIPLSTCSDFPARPRHLSAFAFDGKFFRKFNSQVIFGLFQLEKHRSVKTTQALVSKRAVEFKRAIWYSFHRIRSYRF